MISLSWSGGRSALSCAMMILGVGLLHQFGVSAWYLYPVISVLLGLRLTSKDVCQ